MNERDAALAFLKMNPETHEESLDAKRVLKPAELFNLLGISIGGKISAGTAQGTVFGAIHKSSEAKLIVKISEQTKKSRAPRVGWEASDEAMVEAKILGFLNEACFAIDRHVVPKYFGQFVVAYRGRICTMMVQEEIPISLESAIEACSSTPVALLSFVVELVAAVAALHALGVVHNDLHHNNIRARPRAARSIYRSERDGKEHESLCPLEIVIIDLGRACVRDGVCSNKPTKHDTAPDKAYLDTIRILTSMRHKISTVAANMLTKKEKCYNWRDICALLCIMQFYSTAVGFAWNGTQRKWHRPFASDGTYRSSYTESIAICKKRGNRMPYALAHHIISSKRGPPLLELLPSPSPPKRKQDHVKRLYYEQKDSFE
jgi:serine/threonine protein kinase